MKSLVELEKWFLVVVGAVAIIGIVVSVAVLEIGSRILIIVVHSGGDANEGGGEIVVFRRRTVADLKVESSSATLVESFWIGEVSVFIEEVPDKRSEVARVKMRVKCAKCFCFCLGICVISGGDEDLIEMANKRVGLVFCDRVGICAAKNCHSLRV